MQPASANSGDPVEKDLQLIGDRLGEDFSDVEVETGADREEGAALGAKAWARGRSVSFLSGVYRPGTPEGQEALTHELVHVAQQDGGRPPVGWQEASSEEAREHLGVATEVLEQALLAIDEGRLEALEDDAVVDPERARGVLGEAHRYVQSLRAPEQAATAAEVACLLMESADHELAPDARTNADALQDRDEGGSDALEQEASRVAEKVSAGGMAAVSSGGERAPSTQRAAIALPFVAIPPALIIALGVLAAIYVGVVVAPVVGRAIDRSREREKAKPEAIPKAETDTRRRDWGAMRFQVQWNTKGGGPTFSQVALADSAMGVTVAQAVSAMGAVGAQVSPEAAAIAASPAIESAISWISSRPPGGVATGGYSKSFRFAYRGFGDARADVENIKGHNLRM